MRRFHWTAWCLLSLAVVSHSDVRAQELFGFGKADITPSTALRLTGYPGRSKASQGVDGPLFVRAMAVESSGRKRSVLVSIESRGLPGRLTVEIANEVASRFGIPRSRLVLASTGSHSTPHLIGGPENLFANPLSKEEIESTKAYTHFLKERTLEAIGAALANLSPGELLFGQTIVDASVRKIPSEKAPGPDPSLEVLVVRGPDRKVRGVLFNHASTANILPENDARVSGDWPGYASQTLESRQPGLVAMAFLGCGGDIEPAKRGSGEDVAVFADKVSSAVVSVLDSSMTAVKGDLVPSFGYAGLAPDRPDAGELTKRVLSPDIHVRRHAAEMLKVLSRMGRLPESYPCPVHVWRFGKDLNMVFLGGAPSVDYARRIREELQPGRCWVSSDCDDEFGYIASKATRELRHPALSRVPLYYYFPGQWVEESEDVLVGRVKELWTNPVAEEALSPEEALAAFRLSPGLSIEAVATEPLITDPINIAFDGEGRLWVVEMGDYPRGVDGKGKAGGTIKIIEDTDGDGRFDRATTFLDELGFPTGVLPWKRGALVSCAPEIFYAEDTDGDGRADVRKPLFTGFELRNPQHRVNGFALGLDNWVYLAADTSGSVRSELTGQEVSLSGRDCRIKPDTGEIEPVNGVSQFGREKDDVGHWFGNENWAPIWHYLVPDRYVGRNPYVPSPSPWVAMADEIRFPRVYPASRTVDRFNDLFTANRFTSACSPTIYRDRLLEPAGAAMVCEPVHNLVHRLALTPEGLNFHANRLPAERESEFVASTDTWFRPVRVTTGPDGAVWIADMYRQVIEHPEWIPEAWQQRLDVRSGQDKGRIYRVFPEGKRPGAWPRLARLDVRALVESLESDNGWQRDTAQRLLIERKDPASRKLLAEKLRTGKNPLARLHAMCTLAGLNWLEPPLLLQGMGDGDPFVRAWAVQWAEPMLGKESELSRGVLRLAEDPSVVVRFQVALSLGYWNDEASGKALGTIVVKDFSDPWMRAAVMSSATTQPEPILAAVLAQLPESKERDEFVESLIATTIGVHGDAGLARILEVVTPGVEETIETWHVGALGSVLDAAERGKLKLAAGDGPVGDERNHRVARVFDEARKTAANADADVEKRRIAVRLIGRESGDKDKDLELLEELLGPKSPP
ncbi:MAG: neutral/alkaline non-lysosomal ceramidase N-terminal domain-containing protein [Planctomycetota bacterium]